MSNGVSVDPEEGVVKGTRKLRKSGDSIVVTLPAQVVETAEFEIGEMLTVAASFEGDEIAVTSASEEDDEENAQ
jgi:antitoxin component of MazEF toxin-antitoxin module